MTHTLGNIFLKRLRKFCKAVREFDFSQTNAYFCFVDSRFIKNTKIKLRNDKV